MTNNNTLCLTIMFSIALSAILLSTPISLNMLSSVASAVKQQNHAIKINVNDNNRTKTSQNNKLAILTFGDTKKSQFTTAKPILDKYGFKASFFITCNFVGHNKAELMGWNDILALQDDGQDIESKGMTHRNLVNLSSTDLDFEIGGSKKCLEDHGINSPNIFAVVHGNAWSNPTIIDTIAKYYSFADNGFADLLFLHCVGYTQQKSMPQTDCRTYTDDGRLTFANRYSIREDSHNALDQYYLHDDRKILSLFVEQVNGQLKYNNNGEINAIPIVAYHSIDDSRSPGSTDVSLFEAEMQYLYENGFNVIPMSDLGYDQNSNYLFVKGG
jgi:peptidoglycan/xylan/chitin deacetylase (PgdA/CDA1 family)